MACEALHFMLLTTDFTISVPMKSVIVGFDEF